MLVLPLPLPLLAWQKRFWQKQRRGVNVALAVVVVVIAFGLKSLPPEIMSLILLRPPRSSPGNDGR